MLFLSKLIITIKRDIVSTLLFRYLKFCIIFCSTCATSLSSIGNNCFYYLGMAFCNSFSPCLSFTSFIRLFASFICKFSSAIVLFTLLHLFFYYIVFCIGDCWNAALLSWCNHKSLARLVCWKSAKSVIFFSFFILLSQQLDWRVFRIYLKTFLSLAMLTQYLQATIITGWLLHYILGMHALYTCSILLYCMIGRETGSVYCACVHIIATLSPYSCY